MSSSIVCFYISPKDKKNVAQLQKLMKHLTHYRKVWFPNFEVCQTTYSTMGCNIKPRCYISHIQIHSAADKELGDGKGNLLRRLAWLTKEKDLTRECSSQPRPWRTTEELDSLRVLFWATWTSPRYHYGHRTRRRRDDRRCERDRPETWTGGGNSSGVLALIETAGSGRRLPGFQLQLDAFVKVWTRADLFIKRRSVPWHLQHPLKWRCITYFTRWQKRHPSFCLAISWNVV